MRGLRLLGTTNAGSVVVVGFTNDGNTRRTIDFDEGEKIDEKALKTLVRAAVTLNESKTKR